MMTVQPSAFIASIAGTQRAVTRSGDADASSAQATNRQARAESPGGQKEGIGQVERDTATGDSDADGRQLLSRHAQQDEAETSPDHDHDAPHSISKEGTGARVDFDA